MMFGSISDFRQWSLRCISNSHSEDGAISERPLTIRHYPPRQLSAAAMLVCLCCTKSTDSAA